MIWLYTILLAAALYYLGARTHITQRLWNSYPDGFYNFMACPMCSPFWYTLLIVNVARAFGYEYPGFLDQRHAYLVLPLCAIVVTPMVAILVETGVRLVHAAMKPPEEQPPEAP